MSAVHVEGIVLARRERPFDSLDDFARRSGLSRAVITRLAKAGTFDSLQLDRRAALWEALGQDQKELPLFDRNVDECKLQNVNCKMQIDEPPPISNFQFSFCNLQSSPSFLPPMSPAEEVLADYRTTGLSLRAHPFQFLRADLERLGIVPTESLRSLPNGGLVRVAGIVLVRQRPSTAKGITFVTLEDETGTANLIVRASVWKRHRQAALAATVLLAHGRLQRQGQVIHVLTTKLEDLSSQLEALASQSRDFC